MADVLPPDPLSLERNTLARRLYVAVVLSFPLFILTVTDLADAGRPVVTQFGKWYFSAAGVSREPSAGDVISRGGVILVVVQAVLATPVVFWCGAPLLARFWRSIRRRKPDMFTLIGLGLLASYFFSLAALTYLGIGVRPLDGRSDFNAADLGAVAEVTDKLVEGVGTDSPERKGTIEPFFESAAAIVVFALLGQVLELRARMRTGEAVRKLISLLPRRARVIRPESVEEDVALELVAPGDRVSVKPGERFPVDGLIVDGTTTVDEAMLTGEPLSAEKGPGMPVKAGTQNGLRPVIVEAVRVRDETMLAQVIHLVGQAQTIRVPLQRTVDAVARRFVPIVLLLAATTFASWFAAGLMMTKGDWDAFVRTGWLNYSVICAVCVLIIACPCALGLATPLAVAAGMGRAARAGVLFRDGDALERLSVIDTILFDKTGTLTEAKPWLVAVEGGVGDDPQAVLALAAAVERGSEHPIGSLIVWEAVRRHLPIAIATDVAAVPGKGVRGTVNGDRVAVGTMPFLKESGMHLEMLISPSHSHRIAGHAVVLIGHRDRCAGLVAFSDPLRTTAKNTVAKLKADGVRPVILSGDHADTVRAVAHRLGIEEVHAEALPVEKFAVVERMKKDGRNVAMIGDGMNDAPALAAADVGIALGTGNTIAVAAAGITLVRPDLGTVVAARNLSRATVRTIRQNLWLACAYNVIAIPVAAGLLVPLGGGLITPAWAAAAMSLSTISVLLNSLRLVWRGRAEV
jgi:Cu+-exporting ATPase